jgi:3-oxo-5,6-didehydrosuberyl-CoA/3-oxoadipyl-CoA thiolase
LSHFRLDDLLGMTVKGACERVGVGVDQIEDIEPLIMGLAPAPHR